MKQNHIKYLNPAHVATLKNIELKARFIVEGFITGMHKSPYHGFSVEFSEHRPYNPGESLRNIDWKVYGKTDKLFSKRFEEETNLRCSVVLDVSDSMRYPTKGMSKLEFSAYMTAALQYLMFLQRDAAGLTLFDETIEYHATPKAKLSYLFQLFKKLEEVVDSSTQFTHKTATARTLHEIAQRIHRRSLVVIITDLFDNLSAKEEIFSALKHLRHNKHEVVLFHILDKKTEKDFDFPNRPIVLQDIETGEKIKVQANQIQAKYTELMQKHIAEFKKKCREFQIDFHEIDINESYEKVLRSYLIKRSKLK